MGIYLKGTKMPEDCRKCQYAKAINCVAWINYFEKEPNPDCPLIVVEPHGKLIDADRLLEEIDASVASANHHGIELSYAFYSNGELSTEWRYVEDMIKNAPAVIETEE